MKLVLYALLLLIARCAFAGLEEHAGLVVADHAPVRGGIRVTYLGVSGFQFETGGHALLVDPYFTRVGLSAVALNQSIEPDPERLRAGLAHVQRRVDAVLVTHAHIEHLLDVPPIMRRTGARLVAGPTAVNLTRSLGLPASQCRPVRHGDVRRIGPWTIRVLAAEHDRLRERIEAGPTAEDGVCAFHNPDIRRILAALYSKHTGGGGVDWSEDDIERGAQALVDYEWNGSQPDFTRKPEGWKAHHVGAVRAILAALSTTEVAG